MPESEFILLKRFASNGDAEAFARIIKQHASMVYGVCVRILVDKDQAADAVQDTFFQLVRKADSITGSLPNWLHRVATNKAKELIRTDSLRRRRESIYISNSEKCRSQDEKAAWQEISGYIDQELDNLDVLTREVLILHFFESQTMTEIAKKFGISQPTVSRRIESGVASLRYKLKSHGVIVPAAILTTMLTENIVKAAPASIMKELGKIALAGNKAATGTQIATGISAVKSEIIALSTAALIGIGSIIMYLSYTQAAEPETANNSKPVVAKIPEVNEILDNYTKALDPIQSFIASYESTSLTNSDIPSWGMRLEESKSFERGESRTDGKGRTSVTSFRWGDLNMNERNVPENRAAYTRTVAGDNFVYRHSKTLNQTEYKGREYHGKLTYQTPDGNKDFKRSRDDHGLFNNLGTISYFLGYLDTPIRLDNILKNDVKHISVREEPEMINGSTCFVVEADTKRGDFTIWFDSEHGYHPAKIKAKVGIGDDTGSLEYPGVITKEQGIERDYTLENVRFEKVDSVWIPMEADSKRHVILGNENGFSDEQHHFKFTKITLNPDHEALNSFGNPAENPELDPELEDGTLVYHIGYPSATWQDGKVIEDITGKEVDLNDRGPKVVIGQALPDLSEFNASPDSDLIKNKKILVCFWDMNQRPSRNAILSLNKNANALLEKGLYMVFIHAEEVQERTLISWLKRNEILPPMGVSNNGVSELGYSWGVKSLPWLILTDKNHIVTNEGFSITELDEKIKK